MFGYLDSRKACRILRARTWFTSFTPCVAVSFPLMAKSLGKQKAGIVQRDFYIVGLMQMLRQKIS